MQTIAHDLRDIPPSLSDPPAVEHPSGCVTLMVDHGADLLAMARLITSSDEMARAAVVSVLARSTSQVSSGGSSADSETRRVLVGLVFAACWSTPVDDGICESLEWAATACAYQRAALALYFYGCHTVTQTGELLDLPNEAVQQSLVATLSELANGVRYD